MEAHVEACPACQGVLERLAAESMGSLAERITGPLPARVAVELMRAVTRAVDQIHKAGMLHLDIKPSNILLDGLPDGPWDQVTPMLADFGIARAGDDPGATATGPIGVGGTPSFMAPEQIAGDRAGIGPRSDVFALGATFYSLLTGRPPFQAASVIETLDVVRTREPAPPKTLVPGLPRDLETIALTCLRKDPRRRYASAAALADDLQRWLDGFPIRARPVSKLEHASRWCRRRPALASLLAALALTVASSLVGLLTLWRHSETERGRAEIALARAIASDKATSGAVRDLVGLLTLLEGRRSRRAEDSGLEVAYGRALAELADIARGQERFDEAFVYFQRAEDSLEAMANDPGRLSVIVTLDISRRKIALLFGLRGQKESRRRLLETHIRMLDRLNDAGGGEPAIGLLAALSRVELAPDASAIATLRTAIFPLAAHWVGKIVVSPRARL